MSSKLIPIIGYCDNLSVKPGEKVHFMVSSESPTYHVEIVRLIHADQDPRGPGFKEQKVATSLTGEKNGKHQDYPHGSYVDVDTGGREFAVRGVTVHAWIFPTLLKGKPQTILTAYKPGSDEPAVALYLGEKGDLSLSITNAEGRSEVVGTDVSLWPGSWYSVVASYDNETGQVVLQQGVVREYGTDSTKARVTKVVSKQLLGKLGLKFLIGAKTGVKDPRAGASAGGCFNGKIDSPSLFGSALGGEALDALARGNGSYDGVLAKWDFGRDIMSVKVTDDSPNRLNGHTVNSPKRAVKGRNWTGREIDFKRAPDQYAAIHFHEDDIDDCLWDEDFEFQVPDELKTGIYAAKLEADGYTEYIPFFVRPKPGKTAKIALLIPTISYLAYANEHEVYMGYMMLPYLREAHGIKADFKYPDRPVEKYLFETPLKSIYSFHNDSTGVCYASTRRPLLSIRPTYKAPLRGGGAGASHQFSADLCIVDWLEQKGFEYDIITDHDLHNEGEALLSPYAAVMTGTHPEYYTEKMLDSVDGYLRNGGHLMYLGGNGFYWVTSLDPDRPHILEVRKWNEPRIDYIGEYYHSTTGELGGYWWVRGRAPQRLLGVGFTSEGYDKNTYYKRQPDSRDPKVAFIFEGVDDERIGDFDSLLMHYGAAGDEIDMVDPKLGTPPNTLILATASDFTPSYWPGNGSGHGDWRLGPKDPRIRSDLVYVEYPKGGAVFSVGSMSWCGCLYYNGYDNNVSKITENVLRKFSSS